MKTFYSVGKRDASRKRTPGFWRLPLVTGALLLCGLGAQAQRIQVSVNGDPVAFQGVGPRQIEGRVMVPVRGVLEKLGATVAWMPETRTVVASSSKVDIQLRLGDRRAMVNGREVLLDVPAQEIAGSTFVPLRFLGEALGADVGWNGAQQMVMITTNGNNRPPALHRTEPPDLDRNRPRPRPEPAGVTPTINSFTHDLKGWMRAGEKVHVTLDGTPGGQATFRIPGLVEETPLQETAPGRYTGSWVVPDNKPFSLSNAALIGGLKVGSKAAPLIQAAGAVSVDATAPRIRDRAPEADARLAGGRPNISAVLEDQGSGIDKNAVRLMLDSKDITSAATVTRDFVSYNPPAALAPGQHTVRLIVSDKAGNKTETAWNFTEAPREAGGIKSVRYNAAKALEPGDVLHVEMTGTPGGKAAFSLGSIKNVRMQEDKPGQYSADYTIRKGDDIAQARVAVNLVAPDGERFSQQSERAVTVNTGRPMKPEVTFPGPNDAVTSPLVIKGKATPNSEVHVAVNYQDKVLGALAVRGSAADVIVRTDRNGNWETEPINLRSLFRSRSVEYTISAMAVNAANQQSETSSLKFRLR